MKASAPSSKASFDWRRAFKAESCVADIIARQEVRGFSFDRQKAQFLIHILSERILKIDLEAVPQMPMLYKQTNTFSKPFKKDRSLGSRVVAWLASEGLPESIIGGPFEAIKWEPFDLGKTGVFKEWLFDQGWVPDQWNIKDLRTNSKGKRLSDHEIDANVVKYMKELLTSKSGPQRMKLLGIRRGTHTRAEIKAKLLRMGKVPSSAKITEESLDSVETELGLLVKDRMVWSHRRSLLQGLVKQLRPDGRLSGGANPDATPTHRMRHITVVNIPAPRSPLGKEIRGLFRGGPCEGVPAVVLKKESKKGTIRYYIPANRYWIVGYDGAGLELRMLAHYINDPDFTKELIEGDIHTKNMIIAGLSSRDDAKTLIYAFCYGAGDAKLGLIVGGGSKEGAEIRARMLQAYPGLASLIQDVQAQASTGRLLGLDGRALLMRRDETNRVMTHKALNTLLQAAGAVVMKYAMIWLDKEVKRLGLRAWKVLDVHDEGQWECHPEDVPQLVEIMGNCVRVAGEQLGMNCPLASDAVFGANWYHTH